MAAAVATLIARVRTYGPMALRSCTPGNVVCQARDAVGVAPVLALLGGGGERAAAYATLSQDAKACVVTHVAAHRIRPSAQQAYRAIA